MKPILHSCRIAGCRSLWLLFLATWNVLHFCQTSFATPTSQYSARLWQVQDGLPHHSVTALTQTSDGYLWIGMADGLARFDGVKFSAVDFRSALGHQKPAVSSLCTDQNGGIWIGTERHGLLHYRDGNIRHYTPTNGFPTNNVRALLSRRDGAILIGTPAGLYQLENGKFTAFSKADGLASNLVRCLYEDRNGVVWLVADNTLQKLDGRTIHSADAASYDAIYRIMSLCLAKDGTFLIGQSIGLMETRNGGRKRYAKENGLVDNMVSALMEDRTGNLWIGTYGGLSRWHTGRLVLDLNDAGTSFGHINTLFEDHEGNVWLGTKEGLYRLSPKLFASYHRKHGLSHDNVMSIYENRPGHFWIGTWGGGINWIRDGTVTPYSYTDYSKAGLTSDLILGLYRDSLGHLWIGSDYNGGVFKLTKDEKGDRKFLRWGKEEGLEDEVIRVIHEARDSTMWFGANSGLVRFAGDKWTRYTTSDGLGQPPVRAIIEDQNGLWIGTRGGLSRLADGRFRTFTTADGLSDNYVLALHLDKAGSLWIGTANGGLNRYRGGTFTSYSTKQGLAHDEVFEILEDDRGFLWMSCRKGVFRVSKKDVDDYDAGKLTTIPCATYGARDGMASVQCNGVAKPGAWKATDGRLWFATIKGVAIADPNFNHINQAPPPVVIEEVIADKKRISNFKSQLSNMLVEPGRGELEFHYTALSFQDPQQVRFKYKLTGIDSDWVDAGTRREAHYSNILPGDYEFRVIACNNAGVWNTVGSSVKLTLRPHAWQTWWFKGFGVCAVGGVIATGARFITRRKMQRKLLVLEREHAIERERIRIAQDMHDDLGSRLTEILLVSDEAARLKNKPDEVGNRVERISGVAREVVDNLDALVWTVNPRNDSLDRLGTYIYEYANNFLEAASVRLRFDVPEQLPDAPLPSEMRHELFMTLKEALNNIVKHSGAMEVWIRLALEGNLLRLVIEDNGRGFRIGDVSETGNGLENMKTRVQKLKGDFDLRSQPGKGTRVQIVIPLKAF